MRKSSLRFLAAEAAAHAPALHDDVGVGQAERVAHLMLHVAGMLSGGVDQQLPVLARHHVGDLPFEVEVLLAADAQLALHALRRVGDRRVGIAAPQSGWRQDETVRLQGGVGIEQRSGRAVLVVHAHAPRRHARGLDAAGQHQRHRLTEPKNLALGQHRLVVQHGADGVVRHIGRGQDVHHAGHGARRFEVDTHDARMRSQRQRRCGVQRAGELRQVVDVGRSAGHVQVRALVRQFLADRRLREARFGRVHWMTFAR